MQAAYRVSKPSGIQDNAYMSRLFRVYNIPVHVYLGILDAVDVCIHVENVSVKGQVIHKSTVYVQTIGSV